METRASYVLVGAFVLSLVTVGVVLVMWFAKVEFDKVPTRYLVYFTGNVTGLNVGSPVRYRGVPVGSVVDMRIDSANVERIRVEVEVGTDTPVKQDTIASLGLQGITGVAFIQLTGGTQASPRLVAGKRRELPVIESKLSGLEQVLERAPVIFEKVILLTDRLGRLVDDENLAAVSATLANVREMSSRLGAKTGELAQLLGEGRDTLAALRKAADSAAALADDLRSRTGTLVDTAGDVMTDVQVTLADVRKVAQSVNDLSTQVNGILKDTRDPLRDFSQGGLYEFSQFIAESRVLVAALTRLSKQIGRDPVRFFFGDTQKGFRAQ
jgi:phospholipid/cholesterol/gamma-HCH transport system substrate-binding protein